ncbi:hypothetical protein [Zooshikella harenae]|uniref:Uncharacterized protein n=1 Tax=Zooshikella harenae TaxID=2827238 RepID=A0ABS5ZKC2_9GAMM|nr:hypothetical protein [Zooshikella harenae]MBU2714385.1 hypothetical protein [Zooshikella harenae]
MAKKKKTAQKLLYYRRARWNNQQSETLSSIIINSHSILTTVDDRTFKNANNSKVKCADYTEKNNEVYLRLSVFTPNQQALTIEKDGNKSSSKIDEHPAPEGSDFVNGDAFVYIQGNHVILCTSNTHQSVIENYIKKILSSTDQTSIAQSICLDKVASSKKMEILDKEGIKKIDIKSSLYLASCENIKQKNIQKTLISVSKEC